MGPPERENLPPGKSLEDEAMKPQKPNNVNIIFPKVSSAARLGGITAACSGHCQPKTCSCGPNGRQARLLVEAWATFIYNKTFTAKGF
jgi:hypothetical protein